MIDSITSNNWPAIEGPKKLYLVQDSSTLEKLKKAAEEKLEEVMEELELALKKFEEECEPYTQIRQMNKKIAALRKVSPKEINELQKVEKYAEQVAQLCSSSLKSLIEIKNAEIDRVLEAQKQSRLVYLEQLERSISHPAS